MARNFIAYRLRAGVVMPAVVRNADARGLISRKSRTESGSERNRFSHREEKKKPALSLYLTFDL